MITDLAAHPQTQQSVDTDVLIVGAGIAGLVLAHRLRRNNIRVAILESGAAQQNSETHPLNRVVQLGSAYLGADRGRFRCLGGTSTRWGGALIPFLANDLSARPYLDLPGFPVDPASVQPYLGEVEQLFGIDEGSFEEDFVKDNGATRYVPTGDADFQARFAKWPAFKKRNIANLFSEQIKTDPDLQVSLNATATGFNLDPGNGRLASITARHQSGRSITVGARHFIICAGAIESTRLLLLLDRQHDQRIFGDGKTLGRYFYDHVSMRLASIQARDTTKLNRMAGFRFVGSTMRSLRYELTPATQMRERTASAFCHISFSTVGETGFDVLRHVMRSLQQGKAIRPRLLFDAIADLPYLARLAFWRAAYHQLLWPTPAAYELHVVAEQLPHYENSIALSSATDWFGLPLAAINWRITPDDRRTFGVYQRLFDAFWTRQGLREIGDLAWSNQTDSASSDQASQADVFHPGGTTRMGRDGRSAVVDGNLGVYGVPNLWTASTATFPSGGGANPTLTLIMFSMRLADHLSKTMHGGM